MSNLDLFDIENILLASAIMSPRHRIVVERDRPLCLFKDEIYALQREEHLCPNSLHSILS